MNKYFVALSLAILSLNTPAFAEQALEGGIKANMQEMIHARNQDAVEQMNYTYDMLVEMLDPVGRTKLLESQKTWQVFSAADCTFTTDYTRGEPLEKLIYTDCLTGMTEDRINSLEYQLQHNFTLDPTLALKRSKTSGYTAKKQ